MLGLDRLGAAGRGGPLPAPAGRRSTPVSARPTRRWPCWTSSPSNLDGPDNLPPGRRCWRRPAACSTTPTGTRRRGAAVRRRGRRRTGWPGMPLDELRARRRRGVRAALGRRPGRRRSPRWRAVGRAGGGAGRQPAEPPVLTYELAMAAEVGGPGADRRRPAGRGAGPAGRGAGRGCGRSRRSARPPRWSVLHRRAAAARWTGRPRPSRCCARCSAGCRPAPGRRGRPPGCWPRALDELGRPAEAAALRAEHDLDADD